MTLAKRTVELFYDVISPYSWIAFEVLCRYRPKWNLDLQFRPFFLGGIMAGSGNRPPAMVPAKGVYMMKDIQRMQEYYGIPIIPPSVSIDIKILSFVCTKVGLSADETQALISKTKDQEIKDTLKETTQKALDLGAFGAPLIVAHVNDEPHTFFGSDRFLLIAHLLGVEWEGPLRSQNSKL
ncbi:glutathione S-transferase kappa 1-like [Pocillopora damicornis]|uniref:glutathione S-transferase kappa 1-like n=1 Tax=Pocillopora damicornis TaxID=46731 RepID=UPI000F552778|nr:glutathione S-transferase kappa 1-like [Pocillopora damicornis]